MNNKITAKWAKEQGDSIVSQRVDSELTQCEEKIVNAINSGQNTCHIANLYGSPGTIKELKNRGFSVNQHDDQREGTYLTIKW